MYGDHQRGTPLTFTCIQANLRHSRVASSSFSQLLLDLSVDIALVQEPYAVFDRTIPGDRPSIRYLPATYEVFHNLDHDYLYGAAIFARRSLNCSAAQVISSNHAACMNLPLGACNLKFASVYLRPSIASVSTSLTSIFSMCNPLERTIMGIDANARSPLWNSHLLDCRGGELEGMLSGSVLGLANRPLNELNFVPPGTSFIDVTLHGCDTEVVEWRYLDLPSLSDHPLIFFRCRPSLALGRMCHSIPRPAGLPNQKRISLPPVESINRDRYASVISSALCDQPALPEPVDIERCVKELETSIQSAARRCGSHKQLRNEQRSEIKKRLPWWTRELWGLRNRLRNAYNRAKEGLRRGIRTSAVIAYRNLKSEYQRELRNAEQTSYRKFSTDLNNDLNGTLKAIQAEINPQVSFPSRLVVEDTEYTNPADILAAFGRHFFPLDPPNKKAHYRAANAARAALCATKVAHPEMTIGEVEDAIKSLKTS